MYKFPIRIPEGWKLTKSQGFHSEHNGNDIVCGDGRMTFGVPVVWPFPFPGKPYDSLVDSPVAANAVHAHAQVDGIDPETGILYSVIYIHLSGAVLSLLPGVDSNKRFALGETIGYIGNSGWVIPKPTVQTPFGGSHLHLGLGIKKPGEMNATMVDPSLYFDLNDPFRGADDPTRDKPVDDWAAANGGTQPPIPPVPPIPPAPVPFKFTKNLYFGLQDPDVIELQKRLGVSPTYIGFGPKTLAAVIQYQKAHGITPAVGFVGPITRNSLNK